ncbi:MAG TPA: fibrobacter succinogenes major paralogous domain-containing protein [Clostridiales bacterium]|nr:fibrobacter succinogenes major paralogous domain-containing protein [Clostridiales bacterium]HQP68772.1 fibrobacter succinogenes major paralogous domain-containing protein [Clostridiales bacterium]
MKIFKSSSKISKISIIILSLILIAGCSEDSKKSDPFVDHTGETGTVTDIDGNVYNTIGIGGQIWMAENLKVSHFRNGEEVPEVSDYTGWYNTFTAARCSYDNNPANSTVYGYMYNWYAVKDSRNIAPVGWHVPSDDEWDELIDWIGGEANAGVKLKETGFDHWNYPNEGASNETGFTALPGGWRINMGNFFDLNIRGYWWASTNEYLPSSFAYANCLYNDSLKSDGLAVIKQFGLSVRCVKN